MDAQTMKKALFLDRDGIINVEKDFVHKIEDFEFRDGIFQVLEYFQRNGFILIIITNQSGIARGLFTERDYEILTDYMIKQLELRSIIISKVYYCPFHETEGIGTYKRVSECRKPNPGMIFKARDDFGLELNQCILVGDRETDVLAGKRAGIGKNVLLRDKYDITLYKGEADIVISDILFLKNLNI